MFKTLFVAKPRAFLEMLISATCPACWDEIHDEEHDPDQYDDEDSPGNEPAAQRSAEIAAEVDQLRKQFERLREGYEQADKDERIVRTIKMKRIKSRADALRDEERYLKEELGTSTE